MIKNYITSKKFKSKVILFIIYYYDRKKSKKIIINYDDP